jgi:Glycine zipper
MIRKSTARWATCPGLVVALLCASTATLAQAPPPPAAPPPAKSLAASAGVFAYPSKNQTPAQQAQDEGECYNWAKTQSGYDPMQPTKAAPAAQAAAPPANGARARGAVRGAAAGAVIGEIADDDAGKGAGIGAVAGVMAGGRQSRIAYAQQQQQAAAQTQASQTQLQTAFKQGMGVCLQARGYAVK